MMCWRLSLKPPSVRPRSARHSTCSACVGSRRSLRASSSFGAVARAAPRQPCHRTVVAACPLIGQGLVQVAHNRQGGGTVGGALLVSGSARATRSSRLLASWNFWRTASTSDGGCLRASERTMLCSTSRLCAPAQVFEHCDTLRATTAGRTSRSPRAPIPNPSPRCGGKGVEQPRRTNRGGNRPCLVAGGSRFSLPPQRDSGTAGEGRVGAPVRSRRCQSTLACRTSACRR